VTFDGSGNLYGATRGAGGALYGLSPNGMGGWSLTLTLLGVGPLTAIKFDSLGNPFVGVGDGILTINRKTQREKILRLTGKAPVADALIDNKNGVLYGATEYGGTGTDGTVFEINKTGKETVLYNFCSQPNCTDGGNPMGGGPLVLFNRHLYGTTWNGGDPIFYGVVFEITP
jgi:uncharacterized repeat protein (TIGR03803 family)